jgi:S-adenosylmethionine synthetase
MIKTCEFVSPKHPDKICDLIADSILDAYLEQDKNSRVAIEVMGGHGLINISGEVTSLARINISKIVKTIVGEDYKVEVRLSQQSPDIAAGLTTGGAGDQGIMIGYACQETKNFMPLEYELARHLCQVIYKHFPFDGKTQVTIENGEVKTVVASFQNAPHAKLEKLVRETIKAKQYLINPAGDWNLGGLRRRQWFIGTQISD